MPHDPGRNFASNGSVPRSPIDNIRGGWSDLLGAALEWLRTVEAKQQQAHRSGPAPKAVMGALMDDWSDAERHVERAHELFDLGRWEEAEAEFRKAIALEPAQAEWHFKLGLTLEVAGRLREAIIAYTSAHELDPENVNPLINLGIIHTELGDPEAGLKALQRAQRMSPDLEAAYCPQILALSLLDRHEEAEQVYYMARLIKEECPICCFNLGNSLLNREQFEKAIWCFKEAVRLDPRLPRVHARLGAAYALQGKFEQAIRLYVRDLREDPGNIDTLLELGKLLVEMGRLNEAAEKFRRVLELEPANPSAHFELGKLAIATSRFERACVEFNLVQRLDPDFPGVPLQLAIASVETGMAAEARRQLRTALESFDEDEVDLHQLASLLMAVDMKFEAAEVLRTLIQQDPDDPDAHHRLGCLMLILGRFEDGVRHERQALRLDPTHLNAVHNLLLAYIRTGQRRRAWAMYARAEKIAPRDPGIRRLFVRLRTASLLNGVSGLAALVWRRYRAAAQRRRLARRAIRDRQRNVSVRGRIEYERMDVLSSGSSAGQPDLLDDVNVDPPIIAPGEEDDAIGNLFEFIAEDAVPPEAASAAEAQSDNSPAQGHPPRLPAAGGGETEGEANPSSGRRAQTRRLPLPGAGGSGTGPGSASKPISGTPADDRQHDGRSKKGDGSSSGDAREHDASSRDGANGRARGDAPERDEPSD
ncbi:MAG: tetratricopeptide repeat protein [Planctomycetota bacterium]